MPRSASTTATLYAAGLSARGSPQRFEESVFYQAELGGVDAIPAFVQVRQVSSPMEPESVGKVARVLGATRNRTQQRDGYHLTPTAALDEVEFLDIACEALSPSYPEVVVRVHRGPPRIVYASLRNSRLGSRCALIR
jgi:hypothetical protein